MNSLRFSLLPFFILTTTLVSAQQHSKYEHFTTVKKMDKHVLPNIKSSSGDLIDKQNQTTFNHSLLEEEKAIQKVPGQILRRKKYARKSRINKASQIMLQSRTMSTKDAIPIRRSVVSDVMRVNSTSEFKKKQKSLQHQLPTMVENHEYASVVYDAEVVLYGAAATIKIAQPLVSGENEYSQAYVQIKTGSGQNFESITVGWHVFPKLYRRDDEDNGDHGVRSFLLWTTDGYQTTKCYNYDCVGFEATNEDRRDANEEVYLGDILEISSLLPDIHVKIWKDPQQRIWSLMIDDEVIGKWTNIFHRLGGPFTSVEWGGEVSNRDSEMGSGYFGSQESNGACYIRNLEIVLGNNPGHYIQVPFGELSIRETDPSLYNVSINNDQRYIYFGGPGSMASNP